MNPDITVLLPVYNGEATILHSVKSILGQSFKDFELVIINDGSTDNTFTLVNSIEDTRIRLINSAHQGIAKALNTGIANVTGRYIARMDADDYSYPTRLERQFQFLQKNKSIDVVGCKVKHIRYENDQQGFNLYCQEINNLISTEQLYLHRFIDAPIAHPSTMMRTDIFMKYGIYCEKNVPEDFELWLRLMHYGVKFGKVDEVLLEWHDSKNRLSRMHTNYSSDNFFKIKAMYFAKWFFDHYTSDVPEVWIWGYGKNVFRKSQHLEISGIEITGYIDVKDHPTTTHRKVIHYNDLKQKSNLFILSYVSDRKGKIAIEDFLKSNGYLAGKDYYLMA